MFRPSDIVPLTDFQRNTRVHINRLKKSGRPMILTINGRAAIVMNDAAGYEAAHEEVEAREWNESLKRGAESAKRGKGKPFDQVMALIRDKYIDENGRARVPRRKAS